MTPIQKINRLVQAYDFSQTWSQSEQNEKLIYEFAFDTVGEKNYVGTKIVPVEYVLAVYERDPLQAIALFMKHYFKDTQGGNNEPATDK